ncbi:MAG: YjjG family noncanonical pyrimidine nucleotidase [Clostridia bacterium]|nr:YjjG family noncanonical pyrimidine nucleotidase [Clostridia bacterium]
MRYKAILLDADETILNFELAEEKALKILFSYLNMDYGLVSADYKKINSACWAAYEKGEMTQKELRLKRFSGFLQLHPHTLKAADVANYYENALSMQHDELPGALEAVTKIAASLPIAIVTNGIATIQRPRMENCSMRSCFSEIVISEEVGYSKPRPEMLLIALEKLGGIDKKDALMIGDSLTSDMRAAQNAGIDFLWYNPKGKARPQDAWIQYETDTISDFEKYALID